MGYTRLKYLTEPNPTLYVYGSHVTFTFGQGWVPVENITSWDEFTISAMKSQFETSLDKQIERDSLSQLAEISKFNHIYDEAGLSQLIGSTIIMPVSKALPNTLFITSGGQTLGNESDVRPNWGARSKNRKTASGRYTPIVCGDTKKGWPVFKALEFIHNHPHRYKDDTNRSLARPIKQVQHYCLTFDTPFAFICTESHLALFEFSLSSTVH
jgi:hypothetical protein